MAALTGGVNQILCENSGSPLNADDAEQSPLPVALHSQTDR